MQKAGRHHPLPAVPASHWCWAGLASLGAVRKKQLLRSVLVYVNRSLDQDPFLTECLGDTLVSCFVVDHSKECPFIPSHRFIMRAEPRGAYSTWLRGHSS